MATRKVTVTLDVAQVERIRGLVADGRASSVSGLRRARRRPRPSTTSPAGGRCSPTRWPGPGATSSPTSVPGPTGSLARTGQGRRRPRDPRGHLDAGGLNALERGDRGVLVLVARAAETGARLTVPATALAQVLRHPERPVGLARMIRQPTVDVVPLDRVDATSVGRLLAATATADVADAHVVVCARRTGQQVVTSDPGDLRRLDPQVAVLAV